MNFLNFRNKKIIIISGIVLVLVLLISIAFAALASNLNISFGNVTQNALTWNVGFKGSSIAPTQEGTSNTGLSCGNATVTPSTVTISDTTLSKPGDKCTYSLIIKNAGDISAKLSHITATEPTDISCTKTNENTIICGNITYQLQTISGKGLENGITINKDEEYNLNLIVSYTGEKLNETEINQRNAKFTLTFIQNDKRTTDVEGIRPSENEWTYDYTKKEEKFTAPVKGTYKLEVWGAQGGSYNSTYHGGYGGYSTGTIELNQGDNIYIVVGGAGSNNAGTGTAATIKGGYNGGGDGSGTHVYVLGYASGGGATHMATNSRGVLSNYSEHIDEVLIVAGGGGGSWYQTKGFTLTHVGGNGGGIQGNSTSGSYSTSTNTISTGGTQLSGGRKGYFNSSNKEISGLFGQGGNGEVSKESCGSGGGGGWYGGGGSQCTGGGGGSGYVGNDKLMNKKMVCYDCTVSTSESTKTMSVKNVSDDFRSNYAKQGNGYAKISYIDKDISSDIEPIVNNKKVCKRATSLHTEECTRTSWGCYDTGYYASGSKKTNIITYGSFVKTGTLIPGNAFDCDVNGDNIYDAETERFYYLSGIDGDDTTGYAALLYYTNVSDGKIDHTSKVQYYSTNYNYYGPTVAYQQLPSTTQWSNVPLINATRQIYTSSGTTKTSGGSLPQFTYTDKAARLPSYKEINKACDIIVGSNIKGELDSCEFIMEHAHYASAGVTGNNYWLENPYANDAINIVNLDAGSRRINLYNASLYSSVRPVIEVPLTDIDY